MKPMLFFSVEQYVLKTSISKCCKYNIHIKISVLSQKIIEILFFVLKFLEIGFMFSSEGFKFFPFLSII